LGISGGFKKQNALTLSQQDVFNRFYEASGSALETVGDSSSLYNTSD